MADSPSGSSDPVPEIVRSQRRNILRFYRQVIKQVTPDPDNVKSVADAINQLAGGAPWVGVAIQGVTFLVKCVAQARANKSQQDEVTQVAEFVKRKLEELQDMVQDLKSLDPFLQEPALTLLGASCVLDNTGSRQRCASLRDFACAQSDAAKLEGIATQLHRLLSYINTEVLIRIMNLTPKPSTAPPEVPLQQSGLNKRKEIVMQFLRGKSGTCVVGVFGPGGIGKTTLLHAVYGEVKGMKTHVMAFVEVGQKPAHPLTELQKNLASQLMEGSKMEYFDAAQGRSSLKECLKSLKAQGKRVCMLFDDVWEKSHLKDILSQDNLANILPPASYFFISSRSRVVADELAAICSGSHEEMSDIYLPYSPELLNNEEAKELFVERASSKGNKLLPGHELLVRTIVPLCGGLPLALTVYGSYFSNELKRKKEEWERVAKRLREAHDLPSSSEDKVFAKLEVSLNFQPEAVQDAFLDVAMIYRGWPCNKVKQLLDEEDYLDILVDQSLIITNDRESVGVHDVFSALAKTFGHKTGRVYVTNETPDTELEDLLEGPEGFPKVRGFTYRRRFLEEATEWSSLREALGKMSQLRFLSLITVDSHEKVPLGIAKLKQLRSLHLYGFHSLFLLDAQFSRLKYLELVLDVNPDGGPEDFPKWIGKSKELRSLEISSIDTEVGLSKVDACVGSLSELEKLTLTGHGCLQTLPKEIGRLVSLRALEVSVAFNFERLPEELGALTQLEELNLEGNATMVELPQALGNLSCLRSLQLKGCTCLTTLPESLGNLSSLQELCLSECEELHELPESLGGLISLRDLDLSSCTNLTHLPATLGNLSSCLKALDLDGCEALLELPPTIGNLISLEYLDLQECSSLRELPSEIGNLSSLQSLRLSGCSGLTTLPDTVGGLISLRELDLSGCTSLVQLPPALDSLRCLEKVKLDNSTNLTNTSKSK